MKVVKELKKFQVQNLEIKEFIIFSKFQRKNKLFFATNTMITCSNKRKSPLNIKKVRNRKIKQATILFPIVETFKIMLVNLMKKIKQDSTFSEMKCRTMKNKNCHQPKIKKVLMMVLVLSMLCANQMYTTQRSSQINRNHSIPLS